MAAPQLVAFGSVLCARAVTDLYDVLGGDGAMRLAGASFFVDWGRAAARLFDGGAALEQPLGRALFHVVAALNRIPGAPALVLGARSGGAVGLAEALAGAAVEEAHREAMKSEMDKLLRLARD